jgi:hypothetical protein
VPQTAALLGWGDYSEATLIFIAQDKD